MTERKLRLLCLDGGGVRGLASLYLLKQLLGHVGNPKPCEFFDMICGTSTGGLIAIMLGRLEMTIDRCIEAFTRMMGTIFKQTHKLPFKIINGKVQARYNTRKLEESIKDVIEDADISRDALMRDQKSTACKVFVVAMTAESTSPVHFTDYPKPAEQSNFYNEVKIWEAARATSAATTFFDPINIVSGGITRRFVDGGLGNNNPVFRLLIEAKEVFGPPLEPQIRCILSIGTGKPSLTAFGENVKDVGKSIIDIATETQKTANTFHEVHEDLANRDAYFRFNPPDISGVGLDEAEKRGIIATRTENYGAEPDTKRSMKRFQQAAGEEQKEIKIVEARNPIPPKRFYDLDKTPKFIRPKATSYWHYLTLSSYELYESIYNSSKSQNGSVHFLSFLQQFNEFKTPGRMIEGVWRRLLRDKSNVRNSSHPKGFVMATLYMLHIETTPGTLKLPVENSTVRIDSDRRESLKREWNFVNDIGLHKSGSVDRKCPIQLLVESNSLKNLFASKEMKLLDEMKEKWYDNDNSS